MAVKAFRALSVARVHPIGTMTAQLSYKSKPTLLNCQLSEKNQHWGPKRLNIHDLHVYKQDSSFRSSMEETGSNFFSKLVLN